jgi:hypothetical protein
MNQPPTAVIDACVLDSAPVRDLVIRLAQAGLVRARWTSVLGVRFCPKDCDTPRGAVSDPQ